MNNFKVGQAVEYVSYGVRNTAKIVRVSECGKILHLDNGRWMHAESCKAINL